MTRFGGLTQAMFEVYVPEKWSSHVYNLPRMRNKEAMVALGDQIQQELAQLLAGLSRATSDDIPSIVNHKKVEAQWVYWFRDEAARASLASFFQKTPLKQDTIFNLAPQDKHVILTVVLRRHEIWTGLRLASEAWVDRRNLACKLSKSWERDYALKLMKTLPEATLVGFENDLIAASDMTMERLATYAEQFEKQIYTWQAGYSIPTSEAVSLGEKLVEPVQRGLAGLVGLYRFMAWSKENDLIEASKHIQEEKAKKRRQATSFSPGDRVRFTTGLFAGKTGIVHGMDTKAHVKVLIGKMSVVVPGTDLAAES